MINYVKKLKEHGAKITPQRLALLEELERNKYVLLSAEDLLDKLKGDYPKLNLSTVYRNLELFFKAGFLHKRSEDERGLYKLQCAEHHHHHLSCTSCGVVVHLDYCPSDEMKALAAKEGFSLEDHTIELYGLCPSCQKEKES